MISNLDAKVMDANAEALGISVEALMGNAGKAVADYLIENYHGKRFAFVCGHGNNGGDGFAAAGQMKEENVRIFLIDPIEKIRSPVVKGYLDKSGIKPEPLPHSFSDVDVLWTAVSERDRTEISARLTLISYSNRTDSTVSRYRWICRQGSVPVSVSALT